MKKFIFIMFFVPLVNLFAQDKFVIGADWLNTTDQTRSGGGISNIHLTNNYWNLIRDLSFNFGTLAFREKSSNDIQFIKDELTKANNYGLSVELNNYHYLTNFKRWQYQIENDYDFSTHETGISTRISSSQNEFDPEVHYSNIPEREMIANHCLVLRKNEHLSGYAAKNLKFDSEIPDANSYFLKIRMAISSSVYSHTPVVNVILINKSNNVPMQRVIYADEFNDATFKEITALSFNKTPTGPSIATPDPLPINSNSIDITGVEDIDESSATNSPYEIQIYWYNQVTCYLDFIAIDNYTSNELFTGKYDDAMINYVNNYIDNPGLSIIKVRDEPPKESFLPVRYQNRRMSSLTQNTGYPGIMF